MQSTATLHLRMVDSDVFIYRARRTTVELHSFSVKINRYESVALLPFDGGHPRGVIEFR